MAYILKRRQDDRHEMLLDTNRIDREYTWNREESPFRLPYVFASRAKAVARMNAEAAAAPEWKYELNEYLK